MTALSVFIQPRSWFFLNPAKFVRLTRRFQMTMTPGISPTNNASGHIPRDVFVDLSLYVAARLANVQDASPHVFRHRFGCRMAAKVTIHRLAQIMGHDSLNTTMIYVEATRSDLQKDVETIAWT